MKISLLSYNALHLNTNLRSEHDLQGVKNNKSLLNYQRGEDVQYLDWATDLTKYLPTGVTEHVTWFAK